MDFRFSEEEEAFREGVREFVQGEIPPELRCGERYAFTDELWPKVLDARKALAQKGWAVMHWPPEYGGQGVSPVLQMVLREEMAYWGVPEAIAFDDGPNLIGPTIIQHGSEHLKRTHLPPIARGETFWCQGFTEPGSGSDLAALRTTAVQDGDHYVINGQKDYISGAARADWIHLLARTNPEAPRHRGISYFVADMRSPGITLRPLVEAHGRSGMLNEVFFDDLRVPAENVVGEKDRGWYAAMSTLNRERGGIEAVGRARGLLRELVDYARVAFSDDDTLLQRPTVRSRLGQMATEIEACRLAAYRLAWMQSQGLTPTHEASLSKVLSSEMWQHFTHLALQVLGLHGLLEPGSMAAPLEGRLGEAYVSSISETIYIGTSEIHRNIVAQRGLGLPRE